MEGYGNDNPGAFQSSPSARRATGGIPDNAVYQGISIPAFREEGDRDLSTQIPYTQDISIPAFREEGDGRANAVTHELFGFQSPPSVRKATIRQLRTAAAEKFQSPPSVRKATRDPKFLPYQQEDISIPAFREEGDPALHRRLYPGLYHFNPRLP